MAFGTLEAPGYQGKVSILSVASVSFCRDAALVPGSGVYALACDVQAAAGDHLLGVA